MIVLALDTSVNGCAVCLYKDGQSWVETIDTDRGQAEYLVPLIEQTIAKSGINYSDIDRVAVTIGPGSFTGVRIGLSTAKTLGLTLGKPVLGFSTLDVIEKGLMPDTQSLILVDTKRGDYYGQLSGQGEAPRIWSADDVEQSGKPVFKDILPDSRVLAEMAAAQGSVPETYSPEDAPKPLYLRGAEVSQSKRVVPVIVKT